MDPFVNFEWMGVFVIVDAYTYNTYNG
jgi:hypothetical protein